MDFLTKTRFATIYWKNNFRKKNNRSYRRKAIGESKGIRHAVANVWTGKIKKSKKKNFFCWSFLRWKTDCVYANRTKAHALAHTGHSIGPNKTCKPTMWKWSTARHFSIGILTHTHKHITRNGIRCDGVRHGTTAAVAAAAAAAGGWKYHNKRILRAKS